MILSLLRATKAMSQTSPNRARSLNRLKIVLVILGAGFIVSAAYFLWLIADRQDKLARVSRLDVAWVANKAESEFFRLQHTLLAYRTGESGVTSDDVILRFEIIQSRFSMFKQGNFGSFIQSNEATRLEADRLEEIRKAAAPGLSIP